MKKLKKFSIAILATMAISLAMSLAVGAAPGINADGQRLLAAFENSNIHPVHVGQAQNYLIRPNVNITAAQTDQIIGYVNQAEAILASYPNRQAISQASREQILILIHQAAGVMGLRVSVNMNVWPPVVYIISDGNVVGVTNRPGTAATGFSFTSSAIMITLFIGAVGGTAMIANKKESSPQNNHS